MKNIRFILLGEFVLLTVIIFFVILMSGGDPLKVNAERKMNEAMNAGDR